MTTTMSTSIKDNSNSGLKVAACELRTENDSDFEQDWKKLKETLLQCPVDILLLPEMPFYEWICRHPEKNQELWNLSVKKQSEFLTRLPELKARFVATTIPTIKNGENRNTAIIVDNTNGSIVYEHDKAYLPNEEGVWESTWYNRGEKIFTPYTIDLGNNKRVSCSFQICSELWFMEHGRTVGQQGAHIIFSPRASGPKSLAKWTAGGQALAVVSGCYSISSNRAAEDRFGGKGWIISPEGELIDFTTSDRPIVTVDIDIDVASEAKKTYPRNIGM